MEDTLRQETWDGSMEQTAERLDAVLNECVRTVYPPETRPDDRLFTQPAYQLKLKDMWGVYANYKKLAPWKPRTKMSIRGPEGTILSPEEQLQALLDHSTRKFCHGDPYISEHRMNVDLLRAQHSPGLPCAEASC